MSYHAKDHRPARRGFACLVCGSNKRPAQGHGFDLAQLRKHLCDECLRALRQGAR